MEWVLNGEPSRHFPVYTRGNVSEVFPDPITPLNATTGFLANFEAGYREAFVDTGVWDNEIYRDEVPFALLGCLGGYVYINMSYLRVFAVRVPGYTPELLDRSYGVRSEDAPYERERQSWHEDPERTQQVQKWIDSEVFGATDLARFTEEKQTVLATRAERPDLTRLTAPQLITHLTSCNPLLRRLFRSHAENSLKAGFALGGVLSLCEEAGHPELAFDVVSGQGEIDSAEPSVLISELAHMVATNDVLTREFDRGVSGLLARLRALAPPETKFLTAFDKLVTDWDFRGAGEWELRRPTWGTDPERALGHIDVLRRSDATDDPTQRMADATRRRERATATVRAGLAYAESRARFDTVSAAAGLWVRGRERSRTTSAMLLHEQRLTALELGRRGVRSGALDTPEQIFMLLAEELADYICDPARYSTVLAERERYYLSLYDVEPPFIVVGQPPPQTEWSPRQQAGTTTSRAVAGDTIIGTPGSPGTVRGRVRIITDSETSELRDGEILVAKITDPSWTPLFLSAEAVVTEVGGIFSHSPIVCRELSTPCVVAAEGACATLEDGMLVEVDGTTGTVAVLPYD